MKHMRYLAHNLIGGGRFLAFRPLSSIQHYYHFLLVLCLLGTGSIFCACEKPDLDDYTDPTTRSGEEQNDSTGSVTTILVGTDWEGEKTFTF